MIRLHPLRAAVVALALPLGAALLVGCPEEDLTEEGPVEETAEDLGEAADDVGEGVEEAVDEVAGEGPVEETAEEIDEAVDEAEEELDEATDSSK